MVPDAISILISVIKTMHTLNYLATYITHYSIMIQVNTKDVKYIEFGFCHCSIMPLELSYHIVFVTFVDIA